MWGATEKFTVMGEADRALFKDDVLMMQHRQCHW